MTAPVGVDQQIGFVQKGRPRAKRKVELYISYDENNVGTKLVLFGNSGFDLRVCQPNFVRCRIPGFL